jgi:hypothetical protein
MRPAPDHGAAARRRKPIRRRPAKAQIRKKRDPSGDGHRLRPGVTSGMGDVTGQPSHNADDADRADSQDDKDNPGEDIETGHGALSGCRVVQSARTMSGSFHVLSKNAFSGP